MTPKSRLTAYYVLQKSSDLLKTRISDALLFISVAALIYSLLKGVNFDLKVIFSTLQAETLTLISIGVYVLIWIFAHGSKLILRLTETRELVPVSAMAAAPSRLAKRALATQADIEALGVISTYAFPPQAYSECDLAKKLNTYATWYAAYPNFARLLTDKDKSDEVVGFSVVLPIERNIYLKYRLGHGRPWDWTANDIVTQKSQILPGEPLYLFFQTIYCRRKVPKNESSFLTSVVVDHVKSIVRGIDMDQFVIIAPRKSRAGQQSAVALGFERVRDSEAKFPLYELDSRVIADRDQNAQDFRNLI
jgi:hypothetical protein